jgi:hypothetical protein
VTRGVKGCRLQEIVGHHDKVDSNRAKNHNKEWGNFQEGLASIETTTMKETGSQATKDSRLDRKKFRK